MTPYFEDFYNESKADALLDFIRTQPHVRPTNPRNHNILLRRISYPGYSVPFDRSRVSHYGAKHPIENAPPLYNLFASDLTAFAETEINYLSTIGYLRTDWMNFHQHRRDDGGLPDQTVWVLSLGAVHPVVIRPGHTEGKKFIPDHESTWETLYPKHGSIYILPHAYNVPGSGQEAQHGVMEGNDWSHNGLRVSINAKHIPPGLSPAEFKKAVSRPAGNPNAFVREPGPPRIYRITKAKRYPANAVYVGRGGFWCGQEWPATPFGNHKRLNGDAWKAEVARLMASPEFRAQVESLRGKDLLCWCSPREEAHCHARAWLELANGMTTNTVVGTPEPEPPEPDPPKRKQTRAAPVTESKPSRTTNAPPSIGIVALSPPNGGIHDADQTNSAEGVFPGEHQETNSPVNPEKPIFPDLVLEFCSRVDPRYKFIRDQHYVKNKGAIGQQMHFIVWYKKKIAGIISGGSAVYGVASRDNSFKITKENRKKFMSSIINNTVFRMEYRSDKRMMTKSGRDVPVESMATQVLALWRKVVPFVWFYLYAAIPCGFETLIGETEKRKGSIYKGDNWQYVGRTFGASKSRKGLTNAPVREKVEPKLVYVKKSDDYFYFAQCGDTRFDPAGYKSSWQGKTPDEKQRAREKAKRRRYLTGKVFYMHNLRGPGWGVNFTPREFVLHD